MLGSLVCQWTLAAFLGNALALARWDLKTDRAAPLIAVTAAKAGAHILLEAYAADTTQKQALGLRLL